MRQEWCHLPGAHSFLWNGIDIKRGSSMSWRSIPTVACIALWVTVGQGREKPSRLGAGTEEAQQPWGARWYSEGCVDCSGWAWAAAARLKWGEEPPGHTGRHQHPGLLGARTVSPSYRAAVPSSVDVSCARPFACREPAGVGCISPGKAAIPWFLATLSWFRKHQRTVFPKMLSLWIYS